MPATRMRQLALGQETTWGTGVAATARLMGVTDFTFDVADEVEVIDEMGWLSPSGTARQVSLHAEGDIQARATYEDLMYFASGLFGAGSSAGTGPYTWTYAAPTTAAPTPVIYTAEFADATGAPYEANGVLVNTLSISGEAGGLWECQSNLLGETIVSAAMTTGLAARDVNAIAMADTVLYMDTWGGTMGTTSVASTLISFALEVNTNRHLKLFAGSVSPQNWGEGKWEGTLRLALEFNAAAKALLDALVAPAILQRQIELRATNSTRIAKIQFCGTKSSGTTLFGDRDGNMTIEFTFEGTYHSTYANWLKLILTNGEDNLA